MSLTHSCQTGTKSSLILSYYFLLSLSFLFVWSIVKRTTVLSWMLSFFCAIAHLPWNRISIRHEKRVESDPLCPYTISKSKQIASKSEIMDYVRHFCAMTSTFTGEKFSMHTMRDVLLSLNRHRHSTHPNNIRNSAAECTNKQKSHYHMSIWIEF